MPLSTWSFMMQEQKHLQHIWCTYGQGLLYKHILYYIYIYPRYKSKENDYHHVCRPVELYFKFTQKDMFSSKPCNIKVICFLSLMTTRKPIIPTKNNVEATLQKNNKNTCFAWMCFGWCSIWNLTCGLQKHICVRFVLVLIRGNTKLWWNFDQFLSAIGCFRKWWVSPTNPWVFPTKNDQHLGCEMGVPPFTERPNWDHSDTIPSFVVKPTHLKNMLVNLEHFPK